MRFEVDKKTYTDKLINNVIFYYFLDDQLVKCNWKHKQKAWMESNDEFFLATAGLKIMNNRSK